MIWQFLNDGNGTSVPRKLRSGACASNSKLKRLLLCVICTFRCVSLLLFVFGLELKKSVRSFFLFLSLL